MASYVLVLQKRDLPLYIGEEYRAGYTGDKSGKIGQLFPLLPLSGLLLGGTDAGVRGNTVSTDLIAREEMPRPSSLRSGC